MIRKEFIIAGVLAVAGVAAGVWLFPGKSDVARMEVRDYSYDKPEELYEARFNDGDHSAEVVQQLVRIHTSTGNIDRAIAVMETYVNENPADTEALKQLGTLYQYAQRYPDYMKILESRAAQGDDVVVLTEMAQLYSFFQQTDKQRETLERLYKLEKGANAETTRALVSFYSLDKDFANVATLLADLRARHPNEYDAPMSVSHLNALLQQQKSEEALALVKELTAGDKFASADKATLIDMLHYQGSVQAADEALKTIPNEEVEKSAELLHSQLLILLSQGKQGEAYARLTKLQDEGRLPELLLPDVLYLASVRGDSARFDRLSKEAGFGQLSELQLADIYISASRNGQGGIERAIEKHVANNAESNYPLMRTLILINERSPSRHSRVRDFLAVKQNEETLFKLAEFSAENGDANYARDAIAKLPEWDKLSISQIAALEALYLRLNDTTKAKALVAFANENGKVGPDSEIGLRTAAATGDVDKLRAWHVGGGMSRNPALHDDLFYQASNRGHLQLALEIANWQDDPVKSATGRRNIADVYTRLGRYDDALTLLEQDAPRNDADKRNRIFLASKLAAKSPAHGQRLQGMARQWFPSGSKATKEDITYALMNSGQPQTALPYMKPMADSYGGEWNLAYADALEKAGRIDEATEYRLRASRDPKISPEVKLGLAYALADRGYRTEAETLLTELTKQPALKPEATEALAYIWGPRPTDAQIEWLIGEWKIARTPQEKTTLGDIIAGKLQPDTLEAKIAQHPELRSIPQVESDYLLYLATKQRLQPEIDAETIVAKDSGDTRRLQKLGDIARANGDYKAARSAYDGVLTVHPEFAPALIGGTITAASQSDYNASDYYFERYLSALGKADASTQIVTPDAYQAYFAYAENTRRQDGIEKAQPYYAQARTLALEAPARTPETLSVAAQSSAWMGEQEQSDTLFNDGFVAYPQNKVIRQDKAALLIEQKRYADARELLNSIDPAAKESPQELRASLVDAADVGGAAAPEILGNGEMMVIHTRAENTEPRHWLTGVRSHPSVSYVSEGYDTVLVAANPGHRFVQNGEGAGWSITTTDDTANAYRSESAQTVLRNELLLARLDLETGKLKSASDRMDALEETYQEDPQYLGFAANTYYYTGMWPAAKERIKEARAKSPDNFDIARMQRTIDRTHPDHVRGDITLFNRGDNTDIETKLSGETHVKGPWTVGGEIANHKVKTKNELQPSGVIGGRSGNRQTAHLYGIYSDNALSMWTGSLYANNDTAGLGLQYDRVNSLGRTTLAAEFHKPYTDYIEGIMDDAVRDRLSAYHVIKPSTRWEVGFGGSLNNYSTDYQDDVFQSFGIDLNVVYAARLAQPYIGIGYGILGEYELGKETQLTATNQVYRQFPLRTREIHFGSVTFAHDFSEKTYGSMLLGYGWDRYGGNGPAVEGNINHEIHPMWDVGASAYYGISTSNATDDDLSILNAYVRRRF